MDEICPNILKKKLVSIWGVSVKYGKVPSFSKFPLTLHSVVSTAKHVFNYIPNQQNPKEKATYAFGGIPSHKRPLGCNINPCMIINCLTRSKCPVSFCSWLQGIPGQGQHKAIIANFSHASLLGIGTLLLDSKISATILNNSLHFFCAICTNHQHFGI